MKTHTLSHRRTGNPGLDGLATVRAEKSNQMDACKAGSQRGFSLRAQMFCCAACLSRAGIFGLVSVLGNPMDAAHAVADAIAANARAADARADAGTDNGVVGDAV